MPTFKYKARDKFSKAATGSIAAENKYAAATKLQEMGYVPISIEEARQLAGQKILEGFSRVSPEELSSFTRQLYSLQKAGLPLLSSLEAIAAQQANNYFKVTIEEIARDIRGGLSFSDSLKSHSRIFNTVYVSMVRAAETGGNIAAILERLGQLIDREIYTRSQIKAATQYPMLTFGVLCAAFLIVIIFVIPRFTALYAQFNTALPIPTRILIALNIAITKFWYLFILVVAGAAVTFIRFINSKIGRPVWDNFKLNVPVVGPLLLMLAMSRFARITAILMKSGVPILETLGLVADTSGNVIINRAITHIKESVTQGKGMSEPMKVGGLFPPAVIQMVAAGEQTGRMDELLLSVADYYDTESGYVVKNLTTYIEPILIFVLGGMVLVMALAIFLPMWNIIQVFKQA
ncbi:MAG: type II secretion system F family protein [Candidatus Omnitrophota bacterium]|nr:type II secretion system F family protein [Candidatus Omnitrophota bacterium]